MQKKLLEILACPGCLGPLNCVFREHEANGDVVTGILECQNCKKKYPIDSGIPRFVEKANYASSFGYQWNQFRLEQFDSFTHTNLSEKRFFSETGWTKNWLRGKLILDAGCGAGRFLDIASRAPCEVVGLDISEAVDAVLLNIGNRKNVHLVQGSIYALPFHSAVFNGCYCIGVIQHTPDPEKAIRSLSQVLKRDGEIALTMYEKKRFTKLYSKYLLRPVAGRMNKMALLFAIKALMPVLFPITEILFRIPLIGRFFMFLIPVANYVNESQLSLRQRYKWAILDTFDMFSPKYDQPISQKDAERSLADSGIVGIRRLNNPGLNLVGQKL